MSFRIDHREEFERLLAEARAGDEDAARTLVERFGPGIHRSIHLRLHRRLRPLFDSDDVMQETWATVFRKLLKGNAFTDPDGFLAGVKRVAWRKVQEVHRRHLDTAKRDERRAVSLNAAHGHTPADPRLGPSDEADLNERWDEENPAAS